MYGYRGIPAFFSVLHLTLQPSVLKRLLQKCVSYNLWKPAGIISKHAPERRRQYPTHFFELRNLKKVLHQKNISSLQESICKLIGNSSPCWVLPAAGKARRPLFFASSQDLSSWIAKCMAGGGRCDVNLEPNQRDVNTVFQNYALFPYERGG